jgi:hypothetical protein
MNRTLTQRLDAQIENDYELCFDSEVSVVRTLKVAAHDVAAKEIRTTKATTTQVEALVQSYKIKSSKGLKGGL